MSVRLRAGMGPDMGARMGPDMGARMGPVMGPVLGGVMGGDMGGDMGPDMGASMAAAAKATPRKIHRPLAMVVANQCQRPVASFEHQRCECSLHQSGSRRRKYIKVRSFEFSFRNGSGGGHGETTPKKTQAAEIDHF